MENQFDFKNLFTFEMANNHQGDIKHGLRIIKEIASLVHQHKVRGAIKFQFRQMDTFIHPSHHKNSDNKHIPRFLSTRLSQEEYQIMLDEVRKQNMVSMCTPFDEESVDIITEMGFEVIKVASCSGEDWPLLEKIARAGKPVIFSTGGLSLHSIDNLVSFFEHRGVDFAIMHCVALYPIPYADFNLNQIDLLKQRYPDVEIGWSTHEAPDCLVSIPIAVAKGATIFERHVGVETDKIKLNAYSATPKQLGEWIKAYKTAVECCGSKERPEATEEEISSLQSLQRGVYAKEDLDAGSEIEREQVYFAMPYNEDQLMSGQWLDGVKAETGGWFGRIKTTKAIKANAPVLFNNIEYPENPEYMVIKEAIHEAKAILNEARVTLNYNFDVEYSHHYGLKKFREVGAIIINCINRDYCKKVIVQLPKQSHPSHFHKHKEETFHILHGVLYIELDNKHQRILHPGETILVQPGVWHRFWTEKGVVFEEISTTHYNDDSYYRDKSITKAPRSKRKTVVDHWGRYQLDNLVQRIRQANGNSEEKIEDVESKPC